MALAKTSLPVPLSPWIRIHGKEDVKRLMEKNKDFLEFIHRMSELLVMKLKETSETKKLKETVKQLKNNELPVNLFSAR